MYSLETLQKVNDAAVLEAYIDDKPLQRVDEVADVFHAPDYSAVDLDLLEKASGKEVVDTYFVDSSGLGSADEPALTVSKFESIIEDLLESVDDTIYAVLSGVGQFQVYVTLLK